VLDKPPEPAFGDREFQRAARQAESSAFVAHVRWATAGGRTVRNTHPFGMKGRVIAHNGGLGSLARLEAELGPHADLVLGVELHVRSATSSVHVPDLAHAASVVIASEKLDGENGWRMLAPGEIVHVRPDLGVESWIAVRNRPRTWCRCRRATRTSIREQVAGRK
jgi:predicted glutamine amidotransferase